MVGGNVALSKEETCEGERPAMWRPGDVSPQRDWHVQRP